MKRSAIVLSVVALVAAFSPAGALAQCCGGGGHGQHGGGGDAQHGGGGQARPMPPTVAPQPLGPVAQPQDPQPPNRPVLAADPVTGEPIDFSFKTVMADGPIYFSSDAAIKKFKENPEAYAAQVNEQRAALAKLPRVQVNCPVMGNPIDRKLFAYIEGQGIYFCCPSCVNKYEADPAKYRADLAAQQTYQTRCPVEGDTIDPTVYTDLPSGQRLYFCSKADIAKFAADPARYAPRLAAQGINIDDRAAQGEKVSIPARQPAQQPSQQQGHDHSQHSSGKNRP